jgi:hypothetical protein
MFIQQLVLKMLTETQFDSQFNATAVEIVTPHVFPFTRIPKGKKIDMTRINNPLDPNRLTANTKSIVDTVIELEDEQALMDVINSYKANGKMFDPSLIGTFQMIRIGDAYIDDAAQRLYDRKHGLNIQMKFNERLLSPITATLQASGVLSVVDGMHTLGQVALLAKHGRFGNDPSDWINFEFPFFIVKEPYPGFNAEAALHLNGKGQKKWATFDFHRVYVSHVRIYKSTDKQYLKAEAIQKLCELYECIPLPNGHQDYKKAGTQSHVDALFKWGTGKTGLKTLAFILSTHKKYWHGTVMDAQAYGLYGHLYQHMNQLDIPTTGPAFNKFLDDFHAVINECFVGLRNLRTETAKAHAAWHKAAYSSGRISKVEVPHNCALSIVLKIYQKLGGTHDVSGDAVEFNYKGFDIYSFLDQDMVIDKVNNAI